VFGSSVVPATSLDIPSLTLAGAGVGTLPHGGFHSRIADVDGDAVPDALLDFDAAAMRLARGDTTVLLEGQLLSGIPVRGRARIRVLPGASNGTDAMEARVQEPAYPRLDLAIDNPQRGDLTATIVLPSSRAAKLELFDLGGRRVKSLEVGSAGAGIHRIRLFRAGELSAGVYYLRLVARDRTIVRRVALLL
jgi:hypothetical protein